MMVGGAKREQVPQELLLVRKRMTISIMMSMLGSLILLLLLLLSLLRSNAQNKSLRGGLGSQITERE